MKRLTLVFSEETDKALRMFIAQNGGKKGDLSHFVEEAVQMQIFDRTVKNVKNRNAHYSSQEILAAVEESYNNAR